MYLRKFNSYFCHSHNLKQPQTFSGVAWRGPLWKINIVQSLQIPSRDHKERQALWGQETAELIL